MRSGEGNLTGGLARRALIRLMSREDWKHSEEYSFE